MAIRGRAETETPLRSSAARVEQVRVVPGEQNRAVGGEHRRLHQISRFTPIFPFRCATFLPGQHTREEGAKLERVAMTNQFDIL